MGKNKNKKNTDKNPTATDAGPKAGGSVTSFAITVSVRAKDAKKPRKSKLNDKNGVTLHLDDEIIKLEDPKTEFRFEYPQKPRVIKVQCPDDTIVDVKCFKVITESKAVAAKEETKKETTPATTTGADEKTTDGGSGSHVVVEDSDDEDAGPMPDTPFPETVRFRYGCRHLVDAPGSTDVPNPVVQLYRKAYNSETYEFIATSEQIVGARDPIYDTIFDIAVYPGKRTSGGVKSAAEDKNYDILRDKFKLSVYYTQKGRKAREADRIGSGFISMKEVLNSLATRKRLELPIIQAPSAKMWKRLKENYSRLWLATAIPGSDSDVDVKRTGSMSGPSGSAAKGANTAIKAKSAATSPAKGGNKTKGVTAEEVAAETAAPTKKVKVGFGAFLKGGDKKSDEKQATANTDADADASASASAGTGGGDNDDDDDDDEEGAAPVLGSAPAPKAVAPIAEPDADAGGGGIDVMPAGAAMHKEPLPDYNTLGGVYLSFGCLHLTPKNRRSGAINALVALFSPKDGKTGGKLKYVAQSDIVRQTQDPTFVRCFTLRPSKADKSGKSVLLKEDTAAIELQVYHAQAVSIRSTDKIGSARVTRRQIVEALKSGSRVSVPLTHSDVRQRQVLAATEAMIWLTVSAERPATPVPAAAVATKKKETETSTKATGKAAKKEEAAAKKKAEETNKKEEAKKAETKKEAASVDTTTASSGEDVAPAAATTSNNDDDSADRFVDITIGCQRLIQLNKDKDVDPLVGLFMRSWDDALVQQGIAKKGAWTYINQTEFRHGLRECRFETKLRVPYVPRMVQQLRFNVYDVDGEDVRERDRIGSTIVTLSDLLEVQRVQREGGGGEGEFKGGVSFPLQHRRDAKIQEALTGGNSQLWLATRVVSSGMTVEGDDDDATATTTTTTTRTAATPSKTKDNGSTPATPSSAGKEDAAFARGKTRLFQEADTLSLRTDSDFFIAVKSQLTRKVYIYASPTVHNEEHQNEFILTQQACQQLFRAVSGATPVSSPNGGGDEQPPKRRGRGRDQVDPSQPKTIIPDHSVSPSRFLSGKDGGKQGRGAAAARSPSPAVGRHKAHLFDAEDK